MVLDLTLTTTIFGVPTVLLSPDAGLLMPPWQFCSSRGFFFYFLIVLRQRKLEMTHIKVKAMQRDAVSLSLSRSLFFLNQSHLQLCASPTFFARPCRGRGE